MEQELIKIFDKHRNQIGITSRDLVHEKGYWHETFHCWLLQKENDRNYIYLQIRSDKKKDFPSLIDITAAGHIIANETIDDGIREVNEELGLNVTIEDLEYLGIIDDCIISELFIDKEFGHVYVYRLKEKAPKFNLQKEEVSGIVRTEFTNFYDFCIGNTHKLTVEGYTINDLGNEDAIVKNITKKEFVPHQDTYFSTLATLINDIL
ncbi:NUDIX hydrolase [Bacillus sp. JJ722]|uniref:NUDIX hydrolase n=1 Tax=Bacillus sp. JJ722 TaxID=3122973 RepID=UPI002FFDCFEB